MQRLAARVLAVLSPQLGIKAVSPDTISRIQEEVSVCLCECVCVWR